MFASGKMAGVLLLAQEDGQNCPIVQFDTMLIQSRAQPMKNSKLVNDNCLRK